MTNLPDLKKLKSALTEIEEHLDALDTERGEYMQRCKVIREEIKGVYMQAKEDGLVTKAIKLLVKNRIRDRQRIADIEMLDEDAQTEYDLYAEAAEQWDTTPLGKVARAA